MQTGTVTDPRPGDDWFDRHEVTGGPPYVGMSREDAEAAARSDGIAQIRVVDIPSPPGSALAADYRPGRLNLLIVDGQVVRAAFF